MLLLKSMKIRTERLISRSIGKNCICVFCNNQFNSFLPYAGNDVNESEFIKEIDIVGSNLKKFSCPYCYSSDRERHLLLYMQSFDLANKISGGNVLHFAPEKILCKVLYEWPVDQYEMCDLFPADNHIKKVDIQNTKYQDDCFSLIIANHVLEHVDNDDKAIYEISRIIKTGGYAILQTPYSNKLSKTLEIEELNGDEKIRRYLYGQSDHVRMYGRDIYKKFEMYGLQYVGFGHDKISKKYDCDTYGVNSRENFMIFKKN